MTTDSVRERACKALHRQLVARATEVEIEELVRPAVVFAPHPDDEVLACGGTIIKKRRAGANVTIVFMTDGSQSHRGRMAPEMLAKKRRKEGIAAAHVLGVPEDEVVFLDYPDGRLDSCRRDAVARVTELLERRGPTQVFSPCAFDWHHDHAATSRIVRRAAGGRGMQLLEYSVYMWKAWPWSRDGAAETRRGGSRVTVRGAAEALLLDARIFHLMRRVVSVADVLNEKRAALAEHCSQMVPQQSDPGWWTLEGWSGGDFLRWTFCGVELFAEPWRVG